MTAVISTLGTLIQETRKIGKLVICGDKMQKKKNLTKHYFSLCFA